MCKCEICGKEGKFFNSKENFYCIPGGIMHFLCEKCYFNLMKNKSKEN